MMENKQTAVEWLFTQMWDGVSDPNDKNFRHPLLERARKMEKEQIMNAYNTGELNGYLKENKMIKDVKQYYSETYGK